MKEVDWRPPCRAWLQDASCPNTSWTPWRPQRSAVAQAPRRRTSVCGLPGWPSCVCEFYLPGFQLRTPSARSRYRTAVCCQQYSINYFSTYLITKYRLLAFASNSTIFIQGHIHRLRYKTKVVQCLDRLQCKWLTFINVNLTLQGRAHDV